MVGNPLIIDYKHFPANEQEVKSNLLILQKLSQPSVQELFLIAQNYRIIGDHHKAKQSWLLAFAKMGDRSIEDIFTQIPFYAKIGYIESLILTSSNTLNSTNSDNGTIGPTDGIDNIDDMLLARNLLLTMITMAADGTDTLNVEEKKIVQGLLFALDQLLPESQRLLALLDNLKKNTISIPIKISINNNNSVRYGIDYLFLSISKYNDRKGMPVAAKKILLSSDSNYTIGSLDQIGDTNIKDLTTFYVKARISRDGTANPQKGDLYGQVKVDHSTIKNIVEIPLNLKVK